MPKPQKVSACFVQYSRILKRQLKVKLLMCSNVYDHITGFEVCGFTKSIRIWEAWEPDITAPSNKELVHYKLGATIWQKNSFLADASFKGIKTCQKKKLSKIKITEKEVR